MDSRRHAKTFKNPPVPARNEDEYLLVCNQLYALAERENDNFNKFQRGQHQDQWDEQYCLYSGHEKARGISRYEKEGEDGRVYELLVDNDNDVRTFILHGNDEDKKNGRVGTDGTAVVKIFGENGYDYIKVDDFIDRAKLIYDAAKKILEDQLVGADPVTKKKIEEKLSVIYKAYTAACSEMRKNCRFDDAKHGIRDNKNEAAKEKFDEAYKIARQLYEDLIFEASINIGEARGYTGPDLKKHGDALAQELKQSEIDVIVARGRPIIVKVGKINDQKMLSAQVTHGIEGFTPTSTHRLANGKRKLSNHVTDISAVFNGETKKFESLLSIDSHSSYTPIEEKDIYVRRYRACESVMEKIVQLATRKHRAHPGQREIEIDLATMMMLSPFLNERVDGLRGHESEYMQLKESQMALEMMRHKQPFEMTIDGKQVRVKFKPTYMNRPGNLTQALLRSTETNLQKRVNARGFMEFKERIKGTSDALKSRLIRLGDVGKMLAENIESYHVDDLRYGLTQEEAAQLNKLSIRMKLHDDVHGPGRNPPEDVAEYERLMQIWRFGLVRDDSELNQKLAKSYKALDNAMKAYSDEKEKFGETPKLKQLKAICDNLSAEVKKLEKQLGNIYREIDDINRSRFNQGMGARDTANYSLQINILEILKNKNIDPDLRKDLIIQLRFLRAENMHYVDTSKMPDFVAYHFQVNYLLANYGVDQLIEAFCKSAEDRTGFLRVALFADLAFTRKYGRPPNLLDVREARIYQKLFAAEALELSASLENTKYNSEARSIQVKGKFLMPEYNLASGKQVSTLAKKPYVRNKGGVIQTAKNLLSASPAPVERVESEPGSRRDNVKPSLTRQRSDALRQPPPFNGTTKGLANAFGVSPKSFVPPAENQKAIMRTSELPLTKENPTQSKRRERERELVEPNTPAKGKGMF